MLPAVAHLQVTGQLKQQLIYPFASLLSPIDIKDVGILFPICTVYQSLEHRFIHHCPKLTLKLGYSWALDYLLACVPYKCPNNVSTSILFT